MITPKKEKLFLQCSKRQKFPISYFKSVAVKTGEKPDRVVSLFDHFQYQSSDPKLKQKTEVLRTLKQSNLEAYKKQRLFELPAYVIGEWESRGNLKSDHPTLLIFDIDGGDEGTHIFNLAKAKKSPFIYRVEQSLGGGSRVYVWAKFDFKNRQVTYRKIAEHLGRSLSLPLKSDGNCLDREHIDTVTFEEARMWFPAFTSPELVYHNEDSQTFEQPDLVLPVHTKKPPRPITNSIYAIEFTEQEKIEDIIRQITESGTDITRGQREWFTKIHLPIADYFGESGRNYVHDICQFHPDYTQEETDIEFSRALKKKTGQVTIGSFFDHARKNGFYFDPKRIIEGRKKEETEEENRSIESNLENQPIQEELSIYSEDFFQFYELHNREPKIIYLNLVQLLLKLGFRRYDISGEFFIVKVVSNVVRECSRQEVIDTFENYILQQEDELPEGVSREDLLNKIYGSIGRYFSNDILGRLRPEVPIVFNEHTKGSAFFYYQNGFVEVSKNGIELKPYSELDHHIWENQILKRNFDPKRGYPYVNSPFYQFIKNIASAWEKHPHEGRVNKFYEPTRVESFMTVIGYLLHSFFERELKAVIFTDSRLGEDDEANGRSGKTLLLKALGHILNRDFKKSKTYVELNGKDFDTGRTFKYQELGLDTKLIHINDVQRKFKFEDLFNDITDGIKRERKNEAPSIIRAKVALSTNLTIKVSGSSAKGRAIELELSDYYDDNWTPYREFGKWFFGEWSSKEWFMFDYFMMDCVKVYFQKGVVLPGTINLNERKKKEETSPEFILWMEDQIKSIQIFQEFDKTMLYNGFTEEFPDFSNWLSQRRFTKWLKTFCDYDERFEPITSEMERRANSNSYVTIKRKAQQD